MLAAVKGIVQGNTVVIEDEDIRDYNGTEVIVTLLNSPQRKAKKAPVDWDSFVIPSERGKHVDEYMKEMRENDRLLRKHLSILHHSYTSLKKVKITHSIMGKENFQ